MFHLFHAPVVVFHRKWTSGKDLQLPPIIHVSHRNMNQKKLRQLVRSASKGCDPATISLPIDNLFNWGTPALKIIRYTCLTSIKRSTKGKPVSAILSKTQRGNLIQ